MPGSPARARRAALVAAGGLGRAVLGLACLVLIATLVPGLLGYQRYVVVGGSMEPTIHRGSLVFDEIVPVGQLRVGDVVTYVPPGQSDPVTHRIISRERDRRGAPVFRTKGDANAQPDLRPFTLERPTQARVAHAVPYAGFLFMFLASRAARLLVLVLPAIALALLLLARLWRDAGRMLEEQR
jgi:signal peptidase I